ncbi:MAG TPA: glycosyltransferase [Ktedonobacterales bacterium]|nr:glycosyltransferase [Ktedonobacterales bacterium]
MRVALVHDWLNQMGGAERMLLAMTRMFPDAPIYTSIYDPARVDSAFRSLDIRTSFMQRFPMVTRRHQPYLPFYPMAFEQFDLSAYDLIISDSSAFAKGVITRPDALHICYCHTPMRFAWSFENYVARERVGGLSRLALAPLMSWLRLWDVATAARVDYFIANSPAVAARIAKYYRRESIYIPPPVDTSRFPISRVRGDYFLIIARLIPYKRIDLAVEAFTRLGLPLRIVGEGRDEKRLRAMAGKNVTFLGRLSDREAYEQLAGCRAFIFTGEEDFGIAPVEAQATGKPVIAYGAGGALATVLPGQTGVLFQQQTSQALENAVTSFRDEWFNPDTIRHHAEEFDTSRFIARLMAFVRARAQSFPALAAQLAPPATREPGQPAGRPAHPA